ncbi:MAG: cupin domain-containing protein [Woeseiaceae bacterium]|nr:cupin domain-containing protein [Woeseiaceae bacterium]
MTEADRQAVLRAADIEARAETFSHPFNPNSEITGTHLSPLTGLKRTGVSKVMVPPGKESFAYHSHDLEEEWIYILEGKGLARIDGKEYEVAAGDFMGFPAPGVAHHLTNPFDRELVYLMGGEAREIEIADFPDHGKRMLRRGTSVEIYDVADAQPFDAKIDR